MTNKQALFCASMLGGMFAAASAIANPVLPSGGHVAAGSAAIGTASGASLTVSQTSSKAIVDWSSFSIGHGGTVQFDNGAGATLNRVTGTNVSSIDGLLSATGSVYLINPNGVIIGKTGVVNTGGSFVASTLDVSNGSFLAGGPLTFSGSSVASVANLGHVGSLGGNVGLIAATVRNDGTIAAPRGDVGLAAGTTVTMDDADNDGGGLFTVQVGSPSTSVTNTGAISAAAVELRAQQGNVYALAGNAGGVINATGIAAAGGTIKLISTGGTTDVSGTLSAQGAGGAAGQIETSGETLDIGAANVNAHGGSWLLDPTNLIINAAAASAIDASLASNNVTLTTTSSGAPTETGGSGGVGDTASGPGDIIVAAPMTWSSASLLTLNAFAGITIQAPITVNGGGRLAMNYGGGTSNLIFQLGGDVQFTGAEGIGQSLSINGQAYTLLFNFANSGSHGPDTGLDDIAGIDANAAAGGDTNTGFYALARNVTATGTFTSVPVGSAGFNGVIEGLGNNVSGFILNIGATNGAGVIGKINPTGIVRDLGVVGGSVSGGSFAGGLAGFNYGTMTGDHASMLVTGNEQVGGLIGSNSGLVSRSYATGAVSDVDIAGGLVGSNGQTTAIVQLSYATGKVTSSTEGAGGLVGYNYNGATIDRSYATGAVTSPVNAGGLVGFNDIFMGGDIIENSYATGAVLSNGTSAGGLIGGNDGTVVNSFFDTQTTGRSVGIGDDNNSQGGNVHGLLTVEMQTTAATSLGSAFAGGSGLYPFLTTFFPNGVQAVSGIVYSDVGSLPIPGGTVGVVGDGTIFATVTSGANGYYYAFAPTGTVAAGKLWLAFDVGDTAATLATVTGAASQPGLNLFGKTVTVTTSATTLSTAPTLAQAKTSDVAADGGLPAVTSFINADTSLGLISTSAVSFTVNQTTSTTGMVIQTLGAAPIIVADPITLTGTGGLGLKAGGALTLDDPITVTGGGRVVLGFGAGGLSFDQGLSSFGGSLSFAAGGGGEGIAGQALVINGFAYKLLYSMTDVAAIGASGHYALADPLTSATPFTNAVVATFSGTLEGLGNSITGLTINGGSHSDVGLIGTLGSGGVVRDIGLVGGSVQALDFVGGLVGSNSGTVTDSRAGTNVSGFDIGFDIGGLVGVNNVGGVISDSTASGKVNTNDGNKDVGGLVGLNDGAISSSAAFGRVTSPESLYVGGLVGFNAASGTITSAYASGGAVSDGVGSAAVGGLVGDNNGTIGNTYAYSGPVVGANDVGGLVGYNAASVSASWSSGAVIGTTKVGGAIGLQASGTVSDLYWDEGTSGKTIGVGSGSSAGVTGIGGGTGISPFASATYAGFNFATVWNIIPGSSRPFLRLTP